MTLPTLLADCHTVGLFQRPTGFIFLFVYFEVEICHFGYCCKLLLFAIQRALGMRVFKRKLCHTGRSNTVTLPSPLLVSVTLDTVLSVMSQYLIDVTQVELMESSCGSCLWDIKLKSFSLVWPVGFVYPLRVSGQPAFGPNGALLKSLQVGRNRPLFVCYAADSCCGSVHLSLLWPRRNVSAGMSEAPLCGHPCPT